MRRDADLADQARLIGVILAGHRVEAGKDTLTLCHRGVSLAPQEQDARGGAAPLPLQRFGELVALRIGGQDQQHRDRRQAVRVAVGAVTAFHGAVLLQVLQQPLQFDPRGAALDAERPRDVALGGGAGVVGDPGKKGGF